MWFFYFQQNTTVQRMLQHQILPVWMNEPYLAKGLLTQGHMWQTIALGKTIKIPISVQRQLVCQSSVRQMRIMFTTLKACSILLQPVTNAVGCN